MGIVKTGANLGYPLAIPFQIAQGIQTASEIALIASQQFKHGGYKVKGADDGKIYNNAKFTSKPTAGMLQGANVLLANEDGKQEYFVSNPALNSNNTDIFGYTIADHVGMIDALTKSVPQRATGGYTQTVTRETREILPDALNNTLAGLAIAVNNLQQKGVAAYYGDEETRKIKQQMDADEEIRQAVSKS